MSGTCYPCTCIQILKRMRSKNVGVTHILVTPLLTKLKKMFTVGEVLEFARKQNAPFDSSWKKLNKTDTDVFNS